MSREARGQQTWRWEETGCDLKEPEAAQYGWHMEGKALHELGEVGEESGQW